MGRFLGFKRLRGRQKLINQSRLMNLGNHDKEIQFVSEAMEQDELTLCRHIFYSSCLKKAIKKMENITGAL